MKLNSLRRATTVLWFSWLVGISLLAGYEWLTQSSGVFVFRMLPTGTTLDVEANSATLPSGRTIKLKQKLGDHKPWELNWNEEPEVATMLVFNWKHVLRLGLVLPLFVWVVVELLAAFVAFASKKFRLQNAA